MTVLHVVNSFDVCGRSRMIHQLCQGLRERGSNASIAVLSDSVRFEQRDVEVTSLPRRPSGFDPLTVLSLIKEVRQRNPQVIHAHGSAALTYAALAVWPGRRRGLVYTVHRSDGDPSSSRKYFRHKAMSAAHAITAVSKAAAHELSRVTGYPEENITVIHNGVRVADFASRVRSDRKISPVWGAILNLSPDKDFATLLQGFSKFKKLCPQSKFMIVGDGPLADEAKQLAVRFGVQHDVTFLGHQNDIPDFLTQVDVFVHASHSEGLGMVILEAMAARVPVIASAVGGIPEIIDDRRTGLLFEPGDSEGLCRAAAAVVGDQTLRTSLSQAAFERVSRSFSTDLTNEKYCKVYDAVAEQCATR